ncbi:armadillo-type protein [Mycena amicta]|nr:armadillo-type protein [Mycena amicta]
MSFFNRLSKGKGNSGSSAEKTGGEKSEGGGEKVSSAGSKSTSFFGAATKSIKTRWVLEQTRELLTAHQNIPLTEPTAEKFWGYFMHEHASDDTRNFVVLQFTARAKESEAQAHLVAGFVRGYPAEFEKLYDAPLAKTRAYVALILGYLAGYESTSQTALGMKPCAQLLRLCSDENLEVRDSALFALLKLSHYPDGAQMVVGANVLQRAPEILRSSIANERIKMCNVIANVAKHEKTAPAVLTLKLHIPLVALTSDSNESIQRDSLLALVQLSQWPAGAEAIIDTTLLARTPILLSAPQSIVRAHTCQLLGRLCIHASVPAAGTAVLSMNPCEQLVSLVSDANADVSRLSLFALSKISKLPAGTQPVAAAGAAQFALQSLQSSRVQLQQSAFEILANLVRNQETVPLVLAASPCGPLVQSLGNDTTQHNALVVLLQLVKWSDGTAMAVNEGILQHINALLSPNKSVHVHLLIMQILEYIATNNSLFAAVLATEPCPSLVTLLNNADSNVRKRALMALARVAMGHDGAQAVLDADTLAYISPCLDSSDVQVCREACVLLALLARDESTWLAVLSIDPCPKLVELVDSESIEVMRAAVTALTALSMWPEGREAVGLANMANHDKPNITLRVVSDGSLFCSMSVDFPNETTTGGAETLRMPLPFREIYVWPAAEPHVLDSPELMRLSELLSGPLSEEAGVLLKILFMLLIRLPWLEYPFTVHPRYRTLTRVLFLAVTLSAEDSASKERERSKADAEDEVLAYLRDLLVEKAEEAEVGFTAAWLLVQMARGRHLVNRRADPSLISNYI